MSETAKRPSPGNKVGGSRVGPSIRIDGEISGDEPLTIAGRVEGLVNLPSQQVVVEPNGEVAANVTALTVSIQGSIHGDVNGVQRVELKKTGTLEGNLTTARVAVEEGAVFRGRVDIVTAPKEG